MLCRVTITGADDNVDYKELLRLSQVYPWVEWGLLASATRGGTPRYPSLLWMVELGRMAEEHPAMLLSTHLCGRWARELLHGENSIPLQAYRWSQRVQLNLASVHDGTGYDRQEFLQALRVFGRRQLIVQIGHRAAAQSYFADIKSLDISDPLAAMCVPLFDRSGGQGILPADGWGAPLSMLRSNHPWLVQSCGFAGGLTPANLPTELPKILQAGKGGRLWIDLESGVRKEHDQFDLEAVGTVLDITSHFIESI